MHEFFGVQILNLRWGWGGGVISRTQFHIRFRPEIKIVIDVVTLDDCVLFCLLHFYVMFLKLSLYFHHQYVNIDGLYIKKVVIIK